MNELTTHADFNIDSDVALAIKQNAKDFGLDRKKVTCNTSSDYLRELKKFDKMLEAFSVKIRKDYPWVHHFEAHLASQIILTTLRKKHALFMRAHAKEVAFYYKDVYGWHDYTVIYIDEKLASFVQQYVTLPITSSNTVTPRFMKDYLAFLFRETDENKRLKEQELQDLYDKACKPVLEEK